MAQEQSSRKSLTGWIILAVSLLGLLIAFVIFRNSRKKAQEAREKTPDNEPEARENEQMDAITFYNMVQSVLGDDVNEQTKRIIVAQAMHETGVFTSPVFAENNNAFGMRNPEKRETTSISEARGYAVYETVQDSIRDLQLWFNYNQIPLEFGTPGAYSAKIREYGYYEAGYADYTSALKAHLRKLETLLS
jgi:flagellum-specific peptidoglycan hydrolase FlgJ